MSEPNKLSLSGTIAMGVGALIGGGIFAVLGVAANLAGNAAFLSYIVASFIALASGYSYSKVTRDLEEEGGSFTFFEHYADNKKIAGLVGWTIILGYIGSMAMYAFAFGSFALGIFGLGASHLLRRITSISVILLFMFINYQGVKESGTSQKILTYSKVAILVIFGLIGLWAIFTKPDIQTFSGGIFDKGFISPIISIGAIFVSFQGFQLLTYEYSDMKKGLDTMEKGIYLSIVISTVIYVLIAFVTTNILSTQTILEHKETVLAVVASKLFASDIINRISFLLISLAALFSTASAINSTLFGTARLAHKIAGEEVLPKIFSFRNKDGVPVYSIIAIGAITAFFAAIGELEEITSFASLAFAVVFGAVNFVCLKFEGLEKKRLVPLLGLTGTSIFIPLILWFYYQKYPSRLIFIGVVFLALILLEMFYFEREIIEEELKEVIKRSGTMEEFSREKIIDCLNRAGLSLRKAENIAEEIEEEVNQKVHTKEIERAVEDKLGEIDRQVKKRFKEYNEK